MHGSSKLVASAVPAPEPRLTALLDIVSEKEAGLVAIVGGQGWQAADLAPPELSSVWLFAGCPSRLEATNAAKAGGR